MHTEEKQRRQISQTTGEYPRKHLLVAGAVVAVVLLGALLLPGHTAEATRVSMPVDLNLDAKNTSSDVPPKNPEQPWQEIAIRSGDNLSKVFQRVSLSASDVYDIVSNSKDSKQLLKLHPGEKLAVQVNDAGRLQALKHIHNRLETTLYQREDNKFITTHIRREPEIRQNYSSGIITSSMYRAAQSAGLSQNLIMEMANIFGGVIDFVYDVRAGDQFTLFYQENFLDDKKLGNGPILAAQFTNRGETYTAYRYIHPDGSIGYYNKDGLSMRKAFLRAPLDFTRISSGFNLKRLHPVFKTTKPHRGIDYAASRGTPVYAAGDGRVSKAGYSKANGNYIFIKHGSKYVTKYLHLHKRAVRQGQPVKQRQIIGWVGSTGYATGPHLHYEFLVNGVHRNPRTILQKLPKAESIASHEKEAFLEHIDGLQMQLAAYNNHHNLAKANQLSGGSTL